MPARDGTGPLGQGPRTGRGMGNCRSVDYQITSSSEPMFIQPSGWGGRVWRATFGRLFRRKRNYRAYRR